MGGGNLPPPLRKGLISTSHILEIPCRISAIAENRDDIRGDIPPFLIEPGSSDVFVLEDD